MNPYEPPSRRAEAGRRTRRPPWSFVIACVCAALLVAMIVAGKLLTGDIAGVR